MDDRLAVIVLAAGKGTRMRSRLPKVLHPVAGRPMLLHVLNTVAPLRAHRCAVVAGSNAAAIAPLLPPDTSLVVQDPPLGTAHAVAACRSVLEGQADTVIVAYGDVPLIRTTTLQRLCEAHRRNGSVLTVLTTVECDPYGLGRIVRDETGAFRAIVEEAMADEPTRQIQEVNTGVCAFDAAWLWSNIGAVEMNARGEYFLTDLPEIALAQGRAVATATLDDPNEARGVNDRVQLAWAEKLLRLDINRRLMLSGVTIIDPDTTYIDADVTVGQDTVVWPQTYLLGRTAIGADCVLGPAAEVRDCRVGDRCRITRSVLDGAELADEVQVGPYGYVRPGSRLARGVRLGRAEVVRSTLDEGATALHFSYLGDSKVGAHVNIGAGAITCNYDGRDKHSTSIGEKAFVGSGSLLVAPVVVGPGAVVGAGSVVTHDVAPGEVVYGVPARPRVRRNNRAR